MSIASNLARVEETIAAACKRARRSPADVAIMTVSKTHSPEAIHEAYDAGLRLFGENRVQEYAGKLEGLLDLGLSLSRAGDASHAASPLFHLIGHLQSNKAARAAELFSSIDTLDSLRLAHRLNAAAGELVRTLPVLIEIKLAEEGSKAGLEPHSPELRELLDAAEGLTRLSFDGLLCVPPYNEDAEQTRPYFRQLRELQDSLARRYPHLPLRQLSMGMSHDFAVAVEEGSTCVRIGTALFGARETAAPPDSGTA